MNEKRKVTLLYIGLTYAVTGLTWGALAVLKLPATESVPAVILYLLGQYQTAMLPFFFALMGYWFVTTALYVSTDSVIPCVIFHALINAFAELGFGVTEASLFTYVESLGRLVVGIVVFLVVLHRQRPRSASGASA